MSAFGTFLAVLSAGLILLGIVGYSESFHTVTVPVYAPQVQCRSINNATYCEPLYPGAPPQFLKTNRTQTCSADFFGVLWNCKENGK